METTNMLTETWLSRTKMFVDRYKLMLLLMGVITAGFFLWLLHFYGIGTTPDSANYLSTARHIVAGRGVTQYDGAPLTTWAPFYPAFLAATQLLTGVDVLAISPLVNSLLFGIIVFLSGLLFLKHLKSKLLAFLGTVGVIVAPAFVPNVITAMSESLFILLLLGYLVGFEVYRENARIVWLVVAAIAVGLGCITRYVGIIFIPIGALSILIFCKGDLKSKIVPLVIFVLIAAMPISIWGVRNYLITGYPFGGRGVPTYTLSQSAYFIFNTLLAWYIPGSWAASYTPALLIGLTLCIVLAFTLQNPSGKLQAYWSAQGGLILVVIGYLIVMLYSSVTTTINPPDDRLMSPIFVPLTILVLALLEMTVSSLAVWVSPRLVTIVLGIAVATWFVYPIGLSRKEVTLYFDAQGWGMTTSYWRNLETLNYLVHNPSVVSDCTVYSNATDVLYLVADFETKLSPDKSWNEYIKSHGTIFNAPPGKKICIVWLDAMTKYRPWLVPLETFASLKTFETRAKFSDGGIYAFSKP